MKKIEKRVAGGYRICTQDTAYETKVIVNREQVCMQITFMIWSVKRKIHITPRKGEYVLLDKTAGGHVSHTVFTVPGKFGKGVLVTPTVHGNLLVGPTAVDIEDKEGTDTTMQGIEEIRRKAAHSVKDIPFRQVITGFAGLRAHEGRARISDPGSGGCPGFIDCAGIESPGLTSAPAIGEMAAELVMRGIGLQEKADFCSTRKES
ncbi:MAG: NAD(P)/FAD-dependent oxidoreductase [Mediterraneibacter gnavus]